MGTNIKINILGTLPVTSAKFIKTKLLLTFCSARRYLQKIYYFFLFWNQNYGRSLIFNKHPSLFHNKARFCIFVQFMKSCFCRDFITKLENTLSHIPNITFLREFNTDMKLYKTFFLDHYLISKIFTKFNPVYDFKCFCSIVWPCCVSLAQDSNERMKTESSIKSGILEINIVWEENLK